MKRNRSIFFFCERDCEMIISSIESDRKKQNKKYSKKNTKKNISMYYIYVKKVKNNKISH